MINDKWSKYISMVTITLVVILVVIGGVFIPLTPTEDINDAKISNISEVLNKDVVTEVSIDISEEDWKWLLENATEEEYRSGNITINGETFYNVGIRPKGNSSLRNVVQDPNTDRYSFKIDFGKYVEGQTYHGIETLALNNMTSDASYMKEYLSYDVFKFMDISTPEYSYTNITVNGEEWGLYLGVEVIDERYIQKNYGDTKGNLYKPETDGKMGKGNDMQLPKLEDGQDNGELPKLPKDNNIKNPVGNKSSGNGGADLVYIDDNVSSYATVRDSAVFKKTSDKDFEDVIKMMKSLSTGENIEEYLNVDEVLRYFAVNTFLVNLDSYSGGMYHNYYLYERDGVCEILPWDLNMSFAGFSMREGTKAINFPIDSPVTGNLGGAPLIGKLLEVQEYKEKYHDYLEKLVNEYALSGVFEKTVEKLDSLISDYVKNDKTAFYTFEEYKNAIPQLKLFLKDRSISITEQLKGNQPSDKYGDIATELNLTALGGMNNITNSKPSEGNLPMGNMPNGRPNEGNSHMENMPNGKPTAGGRPNGNIKNPPNTEGMMGSNSQFIKYFIVLAILIVLLIIFTIVTKRYKRRGY